MMKETTKVAKPKSDTTPRKVYNRRNVTHICFDGSHFAPDTDTKISQDHPVTKVTPITSFLLEVHQQVNKNQPAIVEMWTKVVVPRRHKSNTLHGFWKASNAQLTGWTY
jgi:hypothetical protein